MRLAFVLCAVALCGPAALAAQELAREGTMLALPVQRLAPPADIAPGRPMINPDRRCADRKVAAAGREGEAQFRRRPAGPTPPPLYYAVDLEVEGCDMLLTAEGLRQLPAITDDPQIHPAQ